MSGVDQSETERNRFLWEIKGTTQRNNRDIM